MEFKERLLQQGHASDPGINRNIMEFKAERFNILQFWLRRN